MVEQEAKSERSRGQILDAALELFSRQGYRGTSMRDIARAADVSTGSVYHHFQDKEEVFETLLGQYWDAIQSPDFPFNKALASGAFPDDLEALGRAAKESVEAWRRHVALIYVDVVELEGNHIRNFYSGMAARFDAFLTTHPAAVPLEKKLRPGVSRLSAVMLASRIFLHYFSVEVLFGVPRQFGKESDEAVADIADILRNGLLPARTGKKRR
jgi:AcrR family transcriptional regulator